jgi:hypothetical protein
MLIRSLLGPPSRTTPPSLGLWSALLSRASNEEARSEVSLRGRALQVPSALLWEPSRECGASSAGRVCIPYLAPQMAVWFVCLSDLLYATERPSIHPSWQAKLTDALGVRGRDISEVDDVLDEIARHVLDEIEAFPDDSSGRERQGGRERSGEGRGRAEGKGRTW